MENCPVVDLENIEWFSQGIGFVVDALDVFDGNFSKFIVYQSVEDGHEE